MDSVAVAIVVIILIIGGALAILYGIAAKLYIRFVRKDKGPTRALYISLFGFFALILGTILGNLNV